MKNKEFKEVCSAVEQGHEMEVEHHITHQHGKVVACENSSFEVATADGDGEHLQHWERYNCDKEE